MSTVVWYVAMSCTSLLGLGLFCLAVAWGHPVVDGRVARPIANIIGPVAMLIIWGGGVGLLFVPR